MNLPSQVDPNKQIRDRMILISGEDGGAFCFYFFEDAGQADPGELLSDSDGLTDMTDIVNENHVFLGDDPQRERKFCVDSGRVNRRTRRASRVFHSESSNRRLKSVLAQRPSETAASECFPGSSKTCRRPAVK